MLAPLEASKIGIVFLDACRNSATDVGLGMTVRMVSLGQSAQRAGHPRHRVAWRSSPAPIRRACSAPTPRSSTTSPPTAPVATVPFTKALLKHIGTKDIIIQEVMIRVRKSVMEETHERADPVGGSGSERELQVPAGLRRAPRAGGASVNGRRLRRQSARAQEKQWRHAQCRRRNRLLTAARPAASSRPAYLTIPDSAGP